MSVRSELRAAALERDGGCRAWPGGLWPCHGPLEMAHLIQSSQGGPDELDNVVMLCKLHHDILDNRVVEQRRGLGEKWAPRYKRRRDALAALLTKLEGERPWEQWPESPAWEHAGLDSPGGIKEGDHDGPSAAGSPRGEPDDGR